MEENTAKPHWWIMGGLTLTALGVGSYFLFFRKSPKNPKNQETSTNQDGSTRKGRTSKSSEGVKTTKTGQGISIPDWSNPYDMEYAKDVKAWVSPQRIYELNPKDAEELASQLKEAYGGAWYANDDEEAVAAVFSKMLKDKVQVSGLSKAFWKKYQKDMWEYLAGFLSSAEMEKYVRQPVKELVNYRIVK